MIEILDDNVYLRPFVKGDALAFTEAVLESIDTVGRWMPWCHKQYTVNDAIHWVDICQQNIDKQSAYDIGIFSHDDDVLIGGISINQIDRKNQIGNIGYWVRSSFQNRGYASSAVSLIKDAGFNLLHLTRLEIVVLEDNVASRCVAKKVGATFECLSANRLVHNGRPCRAAVYAILPTDNLDNPAK